MRKMLLGLLIITVAATLIVMPGTATRAASLTSTGTASLDQPVGGLVGIMTPHGGTTPPPGGGAVGGGGTNDG